MFYCMFYFTCDRSLTNSLFGPGNGAHCSNTTSVRHWKWLPRACNDFSMLRRVRNSLCYYYYYYYEPCSGSCLTSCCPCSVSGGNGRRPSSSSHLHHHNSRHHGRHLAPRPSVTWLPVWQRLHCRPCRKCRCDGQPDWWRQFHVNQPHCTSRISTFPVALEKSLRKPHTDLQRLLVFPHNLRRLCSFVSGMILLYIINVLL